MIRHPYKTLVGDIETTAIGPSNDPLPKRVHLLILHEVETDTRHVFREDNIRNGVRMLEEAQRVVFHNGIDFDIPVLEKTHGLALPETTEILDTYVLASFFESDIAERVDYDRVNREKNEKRTKTDKFPANLIGSHSLAAWGARLGYPKDDYAKRMLAKGVDPWAEYNAEMEKYCHIDVDIGAELYKSFLDRLENSDNTLPLRIEHTVARIMSELRRNGVYFDTNQAAKLADDLRSNLPGIEAAISEAFPAIYEPDKWTPTEYVGNDAGGERFLTWQRRYMRDYHCYKNYFETMPDAVGAVTIPKVNTKFGLDDVRIKNAPFCKIRLAPLSPGSRVQIVRRLKRLGWSPTEFTEAGNPRLDEDIMSRISEDIPAAKQIMRYLLVNKRLAQLATGKEAWIKHVAADDKIHPRINSCGTITHRATHSNPNMSQVPALRFKDGVPLRGEDGGWGYECRELFHAPSGMMGVGIDLSGLELRCFGHCLEPYDNGKFINILLTSDVHAVNQEIMGLDNRTDAKRVMFATLYMAGNEKIGSLLYPTLSHAKQAIKGRRIRDRLMSGITGFRRLNERLQRDAERRGALKAIDGRMLPVRNGYAALNTMFQGMGAILAKHWIVETYYALVDAGFKCGYDGDFVLWMWSHDEMQFFVREDLAYTVATMAKNCALAVGEKLGFKIPLESEYKIGRNWAECH